MDDADAEVEEPLRDLSLRSMAARWRGSEEAIEEAGEMGWGDRGGGAPELCARANYAKHS
jgi:hypothetical protein